MAGSRMGCKAQGNFDGADRHVAISVYGLLERARVGVSLALERRWALLAAYAGLPLLLFPLGGIVIGGLVGRAQYAWVNSGIFAVYGLMLAPLFFIVSHEMVCGPARLLAILHRMTLARLLGSALDSMVVALIFLTPVIALIAGKAVSRMLAGQWLELPLALSAVPMLVVIAGAMVTAARLAPRLPARVSGQNLSWVQIWRLGRGYSLRLGAACLIWVLVSLASVILVLAVSILFNMPTPDMKAPISVSNIIGMLMVGLVPPMLTVGAAAFSSAAYCALRPGACQSSAQA